MHTLSFSPLFFLNEIISPLNQFEIRNILTVFGFNLSFTITTLGFYLIIGSFLLLSPSFLATNFDNLIANKWSIAKESLYHTILTIVITQISYLKGQKYLPFIYTLFTFILINNLIGMIPYNFASTSHFILTFALSFTIVLGATILGFQNHGLEFFSLLVPSGCPLALSPLLVLIEFISYLARNISLGLRLAANILSGHMLLNILAGFTYNIMKNGIIKFFVGLIPLSFIIAFSGLELGIALIQAQVFTVLTCSYIKDGVELH
jgi:F-type H+-transporting ATPase subunit a